MMRVTLSCVVEGHGEVQSLPILLRRIAEDIASALSLHVPRPIRVARSKLIRAGQVQTNELARVVQLAARQVAGPGGILILLDADDDCPAQLAPVLLEQAVQVCPHVPVGVVLAKREFEAWFLAAAESLGGHCGLPMNLTSPPNPEAIRGAKEWLRQQMSAERTYRETIEQASLTARFDINLARRAPSFDKCYRTVVGLLREWERGS